MTAKTRKEQQMSDTNIIIIVKGGLMVFTPKPDRTCIKDNVLLELRYLFRKMRLRFSDEIPLDSIQREQFHKYSSIRFEIVVRVDDLKDVGRFQKNAINWAYYTIRSVLKYGVIYSIFPPNCPEEGSWLITSFQAVFALLQKLIKYITILFG